MASHSFITNARNKTLKKRLEQLIAFSQELKFLVGFFYFSGWRELYDALKTQPDIHIKLLVGLDVDKSLGQVIEVANPDEEMTNEERAESFFKSLGIALNDEALDTALFYEQVTFFLDLLENNRLEIRKTYEPNHAKLYLFKVKQEFEGLLAGGCKFITGSSNLTRAGIHGQNEFNVEIGDYGTQEAEQYFDELWRTAVPITEVPLRKTDLIRLVRERTQIAEITPYEAYVLVLKTYLDLLEQKHVHPYVLRLLQDHGYKEYRYQMDAVSQALSIIEEYNGVIIADVVGLGKTIIACMIARDLGKRGIVICPPGLIGDRTRETGWLKYLSDFKLSEWEWEVFSCGDLEKAAGYLENYGSDVDVVIIDEAHRFRNEDTENYEWLSSICRNRKVILLTATPFNNAPADIFTMLKLFLVPGKSKITLDEDLENRFGHYNSDFRRLSYISRYRNSTGDKRARAEKYYIELFKRPLPIDPILVKQRTTLLANEIRATLEPVLIRRNRIDLKNDPVYSSEISELSEIEDPREMFYELSKEQLYFYDNVVNVYFGEDGQFSGAIYQPFRYEKRSHLDFENLDEVGNRAFFQQQNLFDFMRRLLVKRFESSFGAFAQSITNFINIHEMVLAFIENSGGKYILDRKLIEKIYEEDPEEIDKALENFKQMLREENLPKHQRVYDVGNFELKDEFLKDIRSDLVLMRMISAQLEALELVKNDSKARGLVKKVHEILSAPVLHGEPRRKVVIFSEYVDTVKHLRPILEQDFPYRVLTVYGALNAELSENIAHNFDAAIRESNQHDDYDILLTSDKMSEGVNLNRAGAVINYDIPWNPTRVIQRVGRINRISKKVFSKLHIYNYFPTEKGAEVVKSREIAQQKMFLIHSTLGEDAKIFDIDETPEAAELFRRINQNPDEMEDESLQTRIRILFESIKHAHPEIIQKLERFPARVKTAKASDKNELLVFRRKALGLYIQQVPNTHAEKCEVLYPIFEQTLPRIECSIEQPRIRLSETFWRAYETVKTHRPVEIATHTQIALDVKALNNLETALHNHKEALGEFEPFVRTLLDDLKNYKTLSKYSLRRLIGVDLGKEPERINVFIDEVKYLRRYLGQDYLAKLHERLGTTKSEIIIAVENQKITN